MNSTAIIVVIVIVPAAIIIIWLMLKLTEAVKARATAEANYQSAIQRLAEQQRFVEKTQQSLKDAFGALSADALRNNNESFVALAKARLEEKVTEAKGELDKKQVALFNEWDAAIDAGTLEENKKTILDRLSELMSHRSYIRSLVREIKEEI